MRRHSAFTLVELMVAVTIGLIVCYAAFLAFRTTSQTVRQLNQIGTENRLMREGYVQALEEVDFWTNYDDPRDATNQRLRQTGTINRDWEPGIAAGMAFTPFAARTPDNLDGSPAADLRPAAADPPLWTSSDLQSPVVWRLDRFRGWDERPYQANDPRRWWRGNLAELTNTSHHHGRYGMFANVRKSPVLGFGTWDDVSANDGGSRGDWSTTPQAPWPSGPYGTVDDSCDPITAAAGGRLPWTWQPNQQRWLFDTLGLYGLFEYQPSNWIAKQYGSMQYDGTSSTRIDERPYQYMIYALNLWTTRPHQDRNVHPWYIVHEAPGLWMSMFRTIPLMPLSPYTGRRVVGEGRGDDRQNTQVPMEEFLGWSHRSWTGSTTQIYELTPLINANTLIQPLLPIRPKEWPDLVMSHYRAYNGGRFLQQMRIRWNNRVTGEVAELPINAYGTTLRGARQQRAAGGGWARWFGPGDNRNDPTLDSP